MGFTRKALLLVFMAWISCASVAEVGVSDTSILVGMTAPLSGPNGAYGTDMKEVIGAYFKQVNDAGGVNGRKLELVAMDDGYDAERAVANTKALINDKKVFSLIGSYGSSATTDAMNDAFGPAKVPLVGTISGAESLRQPPRTNPNNRYMFNVRASYANETEAIVNQLVRLGMKNIAVFYQNDGYGQSGLDGVLAALKKHNQSPSAVATVDRNSLDVSQAVQTIGKANPQAVVMITLYKPTAEFVRQMKKIKQQPQFMTVSSVGVDQLVKELGDDARGIGVSQVMPYPWNDTTPIVRDYHKLIGKQGKVSYYGLEALAMAKLTTEAIRRTGGKELSRDRMVSVLESMQNYDLGGFQVSYSPSDRSGSRFVELTVVGSKGQLLR